jgi:hypothetical protein
MAPTSVTKWFIHTKILESYEELQQYNLSAIHRLSGWVGFEAKDGDRLHQTSGSPFDFIGVFKTSFKHHLMTLYNHSFSLQYDY